VGGFDIRAAGVAAAVRAALDEDIGPGDLTTGLTVPPGRRARGAFYAREPMVVAGVELLELIYELRGPVDALRILVPSGETAPPGGLLAEVEGPARVLLTCERTALNFIQRLSGVATLARRFAEAVRGTGCTVLDTRKTTPGLRRLEKMAAAAGGAANHRLGLYDAILIKNNHIAAAGGVRNALEAVKGQPLEAEIEVRTLDELDQALACGATRLLLDNLTPGEARLWIARIDGRARVELSGGITLENVRDYAGTGADFVSSGAITHSARALDVNFRLQLL
jgi:nicotinate-nucleotide pyrophosphorylase (carboxylating)